jgi:hypothetical protein
MNGTPRRRERVIQVGREIKVDELLFIFMLEQFGHRAIA